MKSKTNDSENHQNRQFGIMNILHNPDEIILDNWSRFILENKDGNIFQTPEMYRVFLDTERYEPVFTALLDENDTILAIMLGVLIEEPGRITKRFSRRIVVYGGPIVAERDDRNYLIERILKAHNDYVKKRAIFTEIRNLTPQAEIRSQFESVGYRYTNHLNILIELMPGIDEIRKGLHKNRRRGIKKAIESGLTSITLKLDDLDDLYSLVTQTYLRIRVPMPPKSFFESVMTILQEKGLARIVGVKLNEELVGAGVFLTYKDVIYLWYNSDNRKYSLGIAEYTFWSAIEWAVENGFTLFDFGGAGRPGEEYGVRDFKKSMGGYEIDLGRLTCTHSSLRAMAAQIGYQVWRAIQWARQLTTASKM